MADKGANSKIKDELLKLKFEARSCGGRARDRRLCLFIVSPLFSHNRQHCYTA